jgi:hypothetical protein
MPVETGAGAMVVIRGMMARRRYAHHPALALAIGHHPRVVQTGSLAAADGELHDGLAPSGTERLRVVRGAMHSGATAGEAIPDGSHLHSAHRLCPQTR